MTSPELYRMEARADAMLLRVRYWRRVKGLAERAIARGDNSIKQHTLLDEASKQLKENYNV